LNAQFDVEWSQKNQKFLAAEFARIRAYFGAGDPDREEEQIDAIRQEIQPESTIDTVSTLFGLSTFERDLLLLAVGVELDPQIPVLCAQANQNTGQPWATPGLALDILPEPDWHALSPIGALRHWRLINLEEAPGLGAGRVSLDERVLHFIAGLNYLDHRLQAHLQACPAPGLMTPAHQDRMRQAADYLQTRHGHWPFVVLIGNDATGQKNFAAALAQSLGIRLYHLLQSNIPLSALEQQALASLWERETVLLGTGLLIFHDDKQDNRLGDFLRRLSGLTIIYGASAPQLNAPNLRFTVNKPEAPEQRQLWQAALADKAEPLRDTIDQLAGQYSLDAERIGHFARQVEGADAASDSRMLHELCRGDGGSLSDLAQPIDARAEWQDLILPKSQLNTLKQIELHSRHRLTVHFDWGFASKGSRGLGIATLFSGESGTGKTLAAEVLARSLGLDLYRIDLASVVSKYIGETEKNLSKIFDAAEETGALLLFDEADALFGKRSEVKDSHDRYANIEVSYLLQRLETYNGLAILTTNHKNALDSAFHRRLRFVVHFPFPDAIQRQAIWRSVFPADTPLEQLDYEKLARLNVTGGTIRNIAIMAAFLAADANTPVRMPLLRRAAQLEAAKSERALSEAELRGWV